MTESNEKILKEIKEYLESKENENDKDSDLLVEDKD